MTHPPTGLYRPINEHDACGVGFVADIKGRASHDILRRSLEVLANIEHRGAAGAEDATGDGAGVLLNVPDAFYRGVTDFALPAAGAYATGIAFLPNSPDSPMALIDAKNAVASIAAEEGAELIGWRPIPVNADGLGSMALAAMPHFEQVFLSARDPHSGELRTGEDLDRVMFFIRKRLTRELGKTDGRDTVYFPSLSARTIVYKGMLTTGQLPHFYPDLTDERVVTPVALVHSRFSTNTFPSWPLAHPYRFIAHNGEINTVQGNDNWMRARESLLRSTLLGPLDRVLPICTPDASDTARLDEALELLTLGGYSLPHAMAMLIPQAWEHNPTISDELRDFYAYHSCLMEPWDGPAAVAFTDGRYVGALLDRNGLRPGRIWITDDGQVIMASEAGVVDVPAANIVKRTRVRPGRMFLIDMAEGRIVPDQEVKDSLAGAAEYGRWIAENFRPLASLPQVNYTYMPHERVVLRQRVFGVTQEDVDLIIRPMALNGSEAIGSMGSDTPIAALSSRPRLLFDYFSQRFAQVTNPPLDSIRERSVTSMHTLLGAQSDVLNPGPEAAARIQLDSPIIDNHAFTTLIHAGENDGLRHFRSRVISGLYPVAHGGAGMREALARVRREASEAINEGVSLIVLSDRESDERHAPLPSLLLTSAVHQHLVDERTRTRASLIIESGDAREVHHLAMLITFGADAINPYLAFESIDELRKSDQLGELTLDEACNNYVTAATTGVLKVMSKMGIAAVASYRGARLADITGLSQELLDDYFSHEFSPVSGIGLADLAADVEARHRHAFLPRPEELAHRTLDTGGEYKWRREGEHHLFNPETIFALQQATKTGDYAKFKDYTRQIDEQSVNLATLRGMMEFTPERESIPLEDVESVDDIVARFSTGAMSYGSISAEAHEMLAIAMNRLGGKSNSGEGGEDPERFTPESNGDWRRSAIKQVASGRFGVTGHYLSNATDIQIKMAQGAKPGEGGQLPPNKVYPWIADVRITTPGVELISPPPHHDIYSIEDLAQLIFDLKSANPDARVHVKLVAEQGVGTVAAGVAKAHADVVLISGHDGGTGASPLTSLKHAGGPWELGLAETQQTLLINGLRDRITVQCDGQLKTGRDVMVAALLGAEEFGFATAPLVVEGCVMMRVCHLDTCPVGIATQNPQLRKRFTGQVEHLINFFRFIAEEVREYLALLGFRTLDEAVGNAHLLRQRTDNDFTENNPRAAALDLSAVFATPRSDFFPTQPPRRVRAQNHGLDDVLDRRILADGKSSAYYRIRNTDRSVGTLAGGILTRAAQSPGLKENQLDLTFTGSAGTSFGAFIPSGMNLTLTGDANDYLGKGLSGGRITVRPHPQAPKQMDLDEPDIIAGNVVGFGATSGELHIAGVAGERFCVRNSGATAVVHGIGNHGCEYMTGGRVVILGEIGDNFGAGMSGGIAYLAPVTDGPTLKRRINPGMVDVVPVDNSDLEFLREILARHSALTGVTVALQPEQMIKVMPRAYRQVLDIIDLARREGRDEAHAIMEGVS